MLLYFSLTLFVSALLLFLVQPMIGKMVLPLLGGTPAVWNTCMVFFQAILLVGYAYTHTLSTTQPRRRQLLVQGALLFLPFLVLPFAIGTWTPPTESNPIFAVLWLLLSLVGLPFFVVSTSAPLLQKWFGHTGHPAARDPYFLYGASNLGSMLALIAYPILIEPTFGVDLQVRLWTYAYAVFLVLVLGCAALVWRTTARTAVPVEAEPVAALAGGESAIAAPRRLVRQQNVLLEEPIEPPAVEEEPERITTWRRLRWVGLAAIPSSLMLGVTTYMTTDIAAVPFFWVTPLALYLLTFILVFARWPVVWTNWPHSLMLYIQPCLLLLLALKMIANLTPKVFTVFGITVAPIAVDFFLHLGTFFATALVAHGELARDRPSARHLTEFYLWMSVGGVLGGLFNSLFAPFVFQYGIAEYPLAMVLAYVLRPTLVDDGPLIPRDTTAKGATRLGRVLDFAVPVVLVLATWGSMYLLDESMIPVPLTNGSFSGRSLVLALAIIAVFCLLARPLRFALALGGLFVLITLYDRHYSEPAIYEGRGFFGLLRVRQSERFIRFHPTFRMASLVGQANDPFALLVNLHTKEAYDGVVERRLYHTLMHGGINHGQQLVEPYYMRSQPITYFHPTNGIGEIFGKFSWSNARLPASLVGLGSDPWTALVGLQSEPPYAVVGLGTGTLAAHARPLQTVHFYEIDPLVRGLSLPPAGETPAFFYLRDALERGAHLDVIMGDGRLQIAKAPAKYYHIITLDAFSSDAVPVHLLTKDAIQIYLEKLADGGVLIFNTTNRYVTLPGVMSALARDLDLDCLYCGDYPDDSIPDKYGADWVVLQRKPSREGFANGGPPLHERLNSRRWDEVEPLDGPVWTDNYSNLFRVLKLR